MNFNVVIDAMCNLPGKFQLFIVNSTKLNITRFDNIRKVDLKVKGSGFCESTGKPLKKTLRQI